jgi:hypothetical protein
MRSRRTTITYSHEIEVDLVGHVGHGDPSVGVGPDVDDIGIVLTPDQKRDVLALMLAHRERPNPTTLVLGILQVLDPEFAGPDDAAMYERFIDAAQAASEPDPDRRHDFDR